MSFVLIACFLRCISLALGANVVWGTSLPSSPSRERNPYRFLECDVQGGDANQIKGVQMQDLVLNDIQLVSKLLSRLAHLSIVPELVLEGVDAALAWMFSQLPFESGRNPHAIVSLSWPTNMEAQDLFPLTSSTYTFPTGTKMDVACFAQNKVVDVERTECPNSFVNSMDPNRVRPCVKVMHGSTRCLHP
jgi:hypothetical protein